MIHAFWHLGTSKCGPLVSSCSLAIDERASQATNSQSASQDEPRPLAGRQSDWTVHGALGAALIECFALAPSRAPEVTNDSRFRLPSGR